jgi:hypothetical protein
MVHVPLDRNRLDLTLHRPVQLDLDQTSALDTQLAVELVLEKPNLGFGWVEAVFVSEAHLVHLVFWPSMVLRTMAVLADKSIQGAQV